MSKRTMLADAIGATILFSTLGCVAFPRGADLQPLVAVSGRYALMEKPAPPEPSGQCENCRGLGKVGDGRVFVVCPACKGTGKN